MSTIGELAGMYRQLRSQNERKSKSSRRESRMAIDNSQMHQFKPLHLRMTINGMLMDKDSLAREETPMEQSELS